MLIRSRSPVNYKATRLYLTVCLLPVLTGCGIPVRPSPETKLVPIFTKGQLPLRVALFVTEEERTKTYSGSVRKGVMAFNVETELGTTLRDMLALSLTPVFERVTVVRMSPPPGVDHLVLIPKITHAKWELGALAMSPTLSLAASLRVLDQSGGELLLLSATGEASGEGNFIMDQQRAFSSAVSNAIGSLVKKWGEQLALSGELEQYAAKIKTGQK